MKTVFLIRMMNRAFKTEQNKLKIAYSEAYSPPAGTLMFQNKQYSKTSVKLFCILA